MQKTFNCQKIIISKQISQNIFNRYYESIFTTLNKNLPQNWTQNTLKDNISIVSPQDFTNEVLSDKANVGICLAQAGMLESAILNQTHGIRAALIHNQYLAQMCRLHNDANIIIISTDCLGEKLVGDLALHYLRSNFDNEKKNIIRVNMLRELGDKYLGGGNDNRKGNVEK